MHEVVVSRTVSVTADRAWEALDNFGSVADFNPDVAMSAITNDVARGNGAERVCSFYSGGQVRERVVRYVAGEELDVQIVDAGPFPLTFALATMRVRPAGEARANVEMRLRFKPKFGVLGWLMGKLMMEGQFRKALGGMLKGLEDHVQTGRRVGRRGVLLEAA
ncbi:MAG: SRPBCC family protein [Gemmatimonadota bacterium]